jgi:hypothetical protein
VQGLAQFISSSALKLLHFIQDQISLPRAQSYELSSHPELVQTILYFKTTFSKFPEV